jgi:acetyltransferase-like isoleucine patch superfamily enzyme
MGTDRNPIRLPMKKFVMIGQHTLFGDYADRVDALGSNIRIENGAVLGINSTVIEHLTLGEYCYVGAGVVVIRDVPPGVVVVGEPAGVKKQRD